MCVWINSTCYCFMAIIHSIKLDPSVHGTKSDPDYHSTYPFGNLLASALKPLKYHLEPQTAWWLVPKTPARRLNGPRWTMMMSLAPPPLRASSTSSLSSSSARMSHATFELLKDAYSGDWIEVLPHFLRAETAAQLCAARDDSGHTFLHYAIDTATISEIQALLHVYESNGMHINLHAEARCIRMGFREADRPRAEAMIALLKAKKYWNPERVCCRHDERGDNICNLYRDLCRAAALPPQSQHSDHSADHSDQFGYIFSYLDWVLCVCDLQDVDTVHQITLLPRHFINSWMRYNIAKRLWMKAVVRVCRANFKL